MWRTIASHSGSASGCAGDKPLGGSPCGMDTARIQLAATRSISAMAVSSTVVSMNASGRSRRLMFAVSMRQIVVADHCMTMYPMTRDRQAAFDRQAGDCLHLNHVGLIRRCPYNRALLGDEIQQLPARWPVKVEDPTRPRHHGDRLARPGPIVTSCTSAGRPSGWRAASITENSGEVSCRHPWQRQPGRERYSKKDQLELYRCWNRA